MFANRYTAVLDACVLVPALQRNILLSLADASFYRLRWSERILDETEQALIKVIGQHIGDDVQVRARAAQAVIGMKDAFADAAVHGYERLEVAIEELPDPNDRHVVAAALMTKAQVIVTDNLRDFPEAVLAGYEIEVASSQQFIHQIVDLDPRRAVSAIETMRARLRRPELTWETLLTKMDLAGLGRAADALAAARWG